MSNNNRSNGTKKLLPTFDPLAKHTLRVLLANMIGEKDRVPDLPDPINENDIPKVWEFERQVFHLLTSFSAKRIPPTVDNLVLGFVTEYQKADKRAERTKVYAHL